MIRSNYDGKAPSPVNVPSAPVAIPESKPNKWSMVSGSKDCYRKIAALIDDPKNSPAHLNWKLINAQKMFDSATQNYAWSELSTSPEGGKENDEYKVQSEALIQIAKDHSDKVEQNWEDLN